MAGDDDIGLTAERRQVVAELCQCGGICPGNDLWRHARPGQRSELFDLGPVGRMCLECCNARIISRSLVSKEWRALVDSNGAPMRSYTARGGGESNC